MPFSIAIMLCRQTMTAFESRWAPWPCPARSPRISSSAALDYGDVGHVRSQLHQQNETFVVIYIWFSHEIVKCDIVFHVSSNEHQMTRVIVINTYLIRSHQHPLGWRVWRIHQRYDSILDLTTLRYSSCTAYHHQRCHRQQTIPVDYPAYK